MRLKRITPSRFARTLVCAAASAILLVGCSGLPAKPAPTTVSASGVKPTPGAGNASANWSARYGELYERNWGIEIAGVHRVTSGYMLEFRYRVLDPVKAQPLIDKAAHPYLHDDVSNVTLSVPALEKVGEVRQTATPQAGRSYFMLFGNLGKIVKAGDRVSVVIGKFRADGLIVQ